MPDLTRRTVLTLGPAVLLAGSAGLPAHATPDEAQAEIAKFTGGVTPAEGKISIDLPEIAENGNTVPMAVTIDAPMEADNYISDILIVADSNPRPGVATFRLTPLAGRATVATRIRLAETENVIVVAKTSTGQFMTARKQVKVTIGGCGG
jgi:sulfur-oxidizing protein SoxY